MDKKLVIAIDGPSASGKGTISKLLSEKFGIPHLNTGGLYRGVAYKCIQQNVDLNSEQAVVEVAKTLNEEDINNPIIFTEEIGGKASTIAKMQSVRDILFNYQRNFANQDKGAILDGRDIGTVICPDEYLDRPLSKDDKKSLCRLIRYNNTNRSIVGWTTIKKKLIENGYKIEEKRKPINGMKIIISIIHL